MSTPIRLTQYSHGAGCGCKISPAVLDTILSGSGSQTLDPNLWVGNASRDDAAVYAIDDHTGIVSTTDFFMPIVYDPFDFGRIAATMALASRINSQTVSIRNQNPCGMFCKHSKATEDAGI